MTDIIDPHFIKALCCEPDQRTLQVNIVFFSSRDIGYSGLAIL